MAKPSFNREATSRRAATLMLAAAAGLGKKTVTGLLCAAGQQFQDSSASYRLFERERFDRAKLFEGITGHVIGQLDRQQPIVCPMDDTQIPKRGRNVFGAKWMADRKGPHFQTNLIWAQRYLQISIALPEEPGGQCSARLVPVEFLHCPLPVKPCVQASQQEVDCYKQQCKEAALANKAGRAKQAVRRSIDNQGHAGSEGATAFSHG